MDKWTCSKLRTQFDIEALHVPAAACDSQSKYVSFRRYNKYWLRFRLLSWFGVKVNTVPWNLTTRTPFVTSVGVMSTVVIRVRPIVLPVAVRHTLVARTSNLSHRYHPCTRLLRTCESMPFVSIFANHAFLLVCFSASASILFSSLYNSK